jgi:5-methylcytosine-specific restriction endonuclease McrBC GTP-binding regulatory subunit McrB
MSDLEQLRARTDRELVAIIDRALDRGLENWETAGKGSAEARQLLPKVYNLGERLRLENKLRALRERMGDLPVSEQPRYRAAAG